MTCDAASTAQIAQALAACGACPPRPPSRRWVRCDLISESRITPGSIVQVDLTGGNARVTDNLGRIAHVRGIYFAANAAYTVEDDHAAIPAYQVRAQWAAMYLKDITGHEFWPNLNGRNILDDQWFRHWTMLNGPYLHFGVQGASFPSITGDNGLDAEVGGTPGERIVDASFYAPLVTLGGRNPLEGLIPLASLVQTGPDALRFTVQPQLPSAVTGVTSFDGFRLTYDSDTPGAEVWLDLVYLDALVVDQRWRIRNYTLSDASGRLNNPTALTEYAWVRYYPEDVFGGGTAPIPGNGQSYADIYDGVSLDVAGQGEMLGQIETHWKTRQSIWYGTQKDGAYLDNNATRDLPLVASGQTGAAQLALMLLPYIGRDPSAGKGALNYEYQSRGSLTATRYAHRTVDCNIDRSKAAQIADAVECNPCALLGTNGLGQQVGRVNGAEPIVMVPRGRRGMGRAMRQTMR